MGVNGIYGLSGSGLDVESLVKVGMMSKQSEYDKLYQKTVKQQWTKEALADIYSDLTTFKYTTLSGFKSQSKLNAMAATTTDSTAVTATANGAAIAMNHKVEVTSLSTNAYWMTDGTITRANTTEAGKNSIKLADNVFYSITDSLFSHGIRFCSHVHYAPLDKINVLTMSKHWNVCLGSALHSLTI